MITKNTLCFILFSCFAQIIFAQQKIKYGNNTATGKYYNIRGIKMYCEVYGSGKPLLMIHGNGGSIKAFEHNIPYFSKKYKVIVADSRAQGKSTDNADSLSFEMMADDFALLLDTLHVDSAYVIGWSDGGINALLLAMRHPDKVIKLVSTGANIWSDSSAYNLSFWQSEKKDYNEQHNKTWITQKEKNNWKLFMLDWNQPNLTLKDLQAIQCPSLIVCGDHDLISIEHTMLIYQNIAKAYMWVVPNSPHATLIEHAEGFNKKADEFFSMPFNEWK